MVTSNWETDLWSENERVAAEDRDQLGEEGNVVLWREKGSKSEIEKDGE